MTKSKKNIGPSVVKIAPKYKIPQSLEEATHLLADYGEKQRVHAGVTLGMNDEIAKIKENAEQTLGPLNKDLEEIFGVLKSFAESRRDELTNNGATKTIQTSVGTMFWRNTPAAASIEDEENFIAEIRKLGPQFEQIFLRTPPSEIDKEALKKPENQELAAQLPALRLTSREEFHLKPTEAPKTTEVAPQQKSG